MKLGNAIKVFWFFALKQSAKEVGQRGSFSDGQWCATSTGKRRRLAGADPGQSCTELVLPGNGGIGVPITSFENANQHRRKGCHTYEPTIRGNDASNGERGSLVEQVLPVDISATDGKRSFMYASGKNRVEGNLSNQRSLMVQNGVDVKMEPNVAVCVAWIPCCWLVWHGTGSALVFRTRAESWHIFF
jgi:hypothetical protein